MLQENIICDALKSEKCTETKKYRSKQKKVQKKKKYREQTKVQGANKRKSTGSNQK